MRIKTVTILVLIIFVVITSVFYKYENRYNDMFLYEIDKDDKTVIIKGYIDNGVDNKSNSKSWKKQYISSDKIEIPPTIKGYPVTAIDDRAFEWAKVKEIVLPDTVTTLGDSVFAHCENLESIEGVENVYRVGNNSFLLCGKLKALYMPNLKQAGELAFAGCEELKEINIPDGMETIPSGMCKGMNSLEEVEIPEGVIVIDSTAFASCSSLKKIYIPSSVTNIKESSFRDIEDQITIYGIKGSYAEEYSKANGIKFEELSIE